MTTHHSFFNNPFEIKSQDVNWDKDIPQSVEYDDRFFQTNTIAEIYNVFIKPNDIEDRWIKDSSMTIGELGYGFGLNFFATAHLWNKYKEKSQIKTLEYVSIDEALPSKDQILKVLKNFSSLAEISKYFLERYEPMHNDMQRIDIPDLNLKLTLIQNQAEPALKNLLGYSNNKINAWFLDGFDPKKNNSMWNSSIAQYVSLLSSQYATFATFTAAGFVKRNFKKFGFEVTKEKGFAAKRHKLKGQIRILQDTKDNIQKNAPRVAIIGSGIAGGSAAYALSNRGAIVDVYESSNKITSGTSSNPVAALYPRFSSNNSPYAYLIAQTYFYADKIYAQFSKEYKRSGLLFTHSNSYQAEWVQSMIDLKREDIFQTLSANEMHNKYGFKSKGLKVHPGGYFFPKLLCKALLNHPNINVSTNHCFKKWFSRNNKIELNFANLPSQNNYDALIIANGLGLKNLIPNLKVSKGQLVGLTAEQKFKVDLPLNSEGYILPRVDGVTWIGSTYEREFTDLRPSSEECMKLISKTEENFHFKLNTKEEVLIEARLRVGTKDRLPVAGKICSNENIYVLGALGSRGFSLAPLLGEFLASQIYDAPNPISTGVALAIDPRRLL